MREWIRKYEQTEKLERYPESHFAPNLRNRVMQDASFSNCLSKKGQTVVLVGKAGVGKTTTVEGIIRNLETKGRQEKVVLGCIFYSRREAADAHHPSKVMMTLVCSLSSQCFGPRCISTKWCLDTSADSQATEIVAGPNS